MLIWEQGQVVIYSDAEPKREAKVANAFLTLVVIAIIGIAMAFWSIQ